MRTTLGRGGVPGQIGLPGGLRPLVAGELAGDELPLGGRLCERKGHFGVDALESLAVATLEDEREGAVLFGPGGILDGGGTAGDGGAPEERGLLLGVERAVGAWGA
jgi:hypothetical protein